MLCFFFGGVLFSVGSVECWRCFEGVLSSDAILKDCMTSQPSFSQVLLTCTRVEPTKFQLGPTDHSFDQVFWMTIWQELAPPHRYIVRVDWSLGHWPSHRMALISQDFLSTYGWCFDETMYSSLTANDRSSYVYSSVIFLLDQSCLCWYCTVNGMLLLDQSCLCRYCTLILILESS